MAIQIVEIEVVEVVEQVDVTIVVAKGDKGDKGDPGSSTAFTLDFLETDWVGPAIGQYSITVLHNRNQTGIDAVVCDAGNQPVDVRRNVIDANTIALIIPADPDMRFAGTLWIRTLQA